VKKILCLIVFSLFFSGCGTAVHITSPAGDTSSAAGETITFSCSTRDFEDGGLSGDAIVRESSIDGRIGSGAAFTSSTLSESTHTIKDTAYNSDGGYDFATVMITVPSSTTTITSTIRATYYVAPDGSPRPQGQGYDIGAFEYGSN